LVADAFELSRAALDGPGDVVVRDALGARVEDGVLELEVHVGIAAAFLGGDLDGAAEFRPQLAAAGVGRALLVLDGGPVRMSGHAVDYSGRLGGGQSHNGGR